MNEERITVRITESGELLDVVVLRKHSDRIEVVLGKGQHSVSCELRPTRTKQAYVGKVMGREIVYERSFEQVCDDLQRARPGSRPSRPR